MKYRNRKSKIKGKRKVRVALYTKRERMIQVVKVIGFISFNTVSLALAGFLSTALSLFFNGVEINFERQKNTFLLVTFGYGLIGFMVGFINSDAFVPVLHYVCQPIVCLRLFLDECIIKLIDGYNKIVDRISNRGE
jgi:hypothetical protein